ncbi:hypothetical protein GOBAR_DD12717 [Gossypium barbadense]|nr:hypothetical protein GOBAR_DD12717 [Gossypium barbadense]
MGNYNTIQGGKGYVKRSKRKKLAVDDSLNKPAPTHDGIKSVMADNLCNFSTNSDLCICMVTWNMNGQIAGGGNYAVSATICVWNEEFIHVRQRRVWRNEEKKERGSGNQYQLQRTQVGVYHLSSLCSCSERRREKFTVPAHIALSVFQLLRSKDQLLQEAERGQIFNGYCEGTIAFKPTYKYNVGSSNYGSSSSMDRSNLVQDRRSK